MYRFILVLSVTAVTGCIRNPAPENEISDPSSQVEVPEICHPDQIQVDDNGTECRCDTSGQWSCQPEINPVCPLDNNGEPRCDTEMADSGPNTPPTIDPSQDDPSHDDPSQDDPSQDDPSQDDPTAPICQADDVRQDTNGDECVCDALGQWICQPAIESICGDGVLDPETESCDDGNDIETDGCTSACVIASAELCDDPMVAGQAMCDSANTVSLIDVRARTILDNLTHNDRGLKMMAADDRTLLVADQLDGLHVVRFLERNDLGEFVEVKTVSMRQLRGMAIQGNSAVWMGDSEAEIFERNDEGDWQQVLRIYTTRSMHDVAIVDGQVFLSGYGAFAWGEINKVTQCARLFRRNAEGDWSEGPDLDSFLTERNICNQRPAMGTVLSHIAHGHLFLRGHAYRITNDDNYEEISGIEGIVRSARNHIVTVADDWREPNGEIDIYMWSEQTEHYEFIQSLNSSSTILERYRRGSPVDVVSMISEDKIVLAYSYFPEGADRKTEVEMYSLGVDGRWAYSHQVQFDDDADFIVQSGRRGAVRIPQIARMGDALLIEHWLPEFGTRILEADLNPKPICTEAGACLCLPGAGGPLCRD